MAHGDTVQPTVPTRSTATELRLFISSTFVDFLAERDTLAKRVFPALRRLCRERGIEFTEIDLRWGLTTEDSQNGRIIRTCLEEIDNCRPFFIGLIGQRYGWVPPIEELRKDPELMTEQPWLEPAALAGQSVTEMEFRHGFLNNGFGSTKPLVYARALPTDYVEDPRISALKQEVVHSLRADIPQFATPDELATLIERDLTELIDHHWPQQEKQSWLEEERTGHAAFAQSRRKAYVPNPTLSAALETQLADPEAPVIILTGESGSGKSSLLAYWAEEVRRAKGKKSRKKAPSKNAFVIEHFIGVTPASTDADTLVRRIIEEIRERTGADEPVPLSAEEREAALPSWLARLSEERLIVVVDAINQLSPDGQLLRWLPEYLPANIQWVFSALEGTALSGLRARARSAGQRWPEIAVKPLRVQERRKVLRAFLADYQKKLHKGQEDTIVHDKKASSPLFLRTLLEELRLQGKHEELDHQIGHYLASADIPDLFTRILERVETDYGPSDVQVLLARLWAAPHGLSESEIIESCQMDRAGLSLLLHAFDFHFVRTSGRLSFFHDHLRSAVERRYLPAASDKKAAWSQLATYFQGADASAIKAHSLPWLWNKAEDWGALQQSLLDIDLVLYLAEGSRSYDLLGYWLTLNKQTLGDEDGLAQAQATAQAAGGGMKQWSIDVPAAYEGALVERSVLLTPDEERSIRHALSVFFNNAGWFGGAISNARRAIELCYDGEHVHAELRDQAIDLSLELGLSCRDSGDFNSAAEALTNAVAFMEERHDVLDLRELRVKAEYGKILQQQGKYPEAENILRVTLGSAIERYGQAHPIAQRAMRYLADVLALERKLQEAEEFYRAILTRTELTLGQESLDTAEAAHELAHFLMRFGGDYQESLSLFERCLGIMQSRLGENHPDLGTVFNNMGSLHMQNGFPSLAEPLLLRSVQIGEQAHGPDHPKTATSLDNYANLLSRQGKLDVAEPIYRRALAIRRGALGEDHPVTAISYNNLANNLSRQQIMKEQPSYDEARHCYERSCEILIATLGPKHLYTGHTLASLGRLLRTMDDPVSAANNLRRGYEIEKAGQVHGGFDAISTGIDLTEVLLAISPTEDVTELLKELRASAQGIILRPDLALRLNNLLERSGLEQGVA